MGRHSLSRLCRGCSISDKELPLSAKALRAARCANWLRRGTVPPRESSRTHEDAPGSSGASSRSRRFRLQGPQTYVLCISTDALSAVAVWVDGAGGLSLWVGSGHFTLRAQQKRNVARWRRSTE